jgi:hypothetical protein
MPIHSNGTMNGHINPIQYSNYCQGLIVYRVPSRELSIIEFIRNRPLFHRPPCLANPCGVEAPNIETFFTHPRVKPHRLPTPSVLFLLA